MGGMVMGANTSAPTPPTRALGAWLARTNNTVYLAATDGFICGFGTSPGGSSVAMLTDGSTPPTTQRNVNGSTTSATGACSPVKAGDYWKATGVDGALFWIPEEA